MTKKNILAAVILLIGSLLFSCSKDGLPKGTPACIKAKIDALKNQPKQNPPAKVYRYDYKGQTVYFFPAACCDQMSALYDDKCNLICSPDGGFTGQGDGKCADFFTARTNEVLIWEDKR